MNSRSLLYTSYENNDDLTSAEEDEVKSSDDEGIDKSLEYFKAKVLKSQKSMAKSESEVKKDFVNDFENEMDQELDKLVEKKSQTYSGRLNITREEGKVVESENKRVDVEEEDTDSEAELETGVRTTKKRPNFTNDELFYDPDMDRLDENWINKQRGTCQKKSILKKESDFTDTASASASNANYTDARTDAILNCPCCMTLLCMDCQRHEKYRTQYRAMFVFNCNVKQYEQLKYPKEKAFERKKDNRKKTKRVEDNAKAPIEPANQSEVEYEVFKPVECNSCKAEVGVYEEKEEIYHFFNILASHS